MSHRRFQLAQFEKQIMWLDKDDASKTYRDAISVCSTVRHGLDESAFTCIERHDVGDEYERAWEWLAPRIGSSELNVVFSESDVCRMKADLFVSNWQDLFCPSCDDVVIVPEAGMWVLFYWHEDEFEFGMR